MASRRGAPALVPTLNYRQHRTAAAGVRQGRLGGPGGGGGRAGEKPDGGSTAGVVPEWGGVLLPRVPEQPEGVKGQRGRGEGDEEGGLGRGRAGAGPQGRGRRPSLLQNIATQFDPRPKYYNTI